MLTIFVYVWFFIKVDSVLEKFLATLLALPAVWVKALWLSLVSFLNSMAAFN